MSSIEGIEDPFGPGTAGGTALLEREETQLSEPGDHERFSHYVRKEKILESALTGEPVRALCGKMWVPGRDPQKFPVCPQCKENLRRPRTGNDGDNGSGDNTRQATRLRQIRLNKYE